MDSRPPLAHPSRIPLWRDERVLRIFGQVVFLAILIAIFAYLASNMLANMRQQGLELGYDFLRLTSGFDIGEHLIPYDRSHTFLRALLVGLLNTALVAILGIFFATILGVTFGILRLSSNYLVQQLARAYIELLRNIPLLVLLIFLYTAVFIQLPRINEAIILPGPVLLTNRGIAIPWAAPTGTFLFYLGLLGLAAALLAGVYAILEWQARRTGRPRKAFFWAFLILLVIGVLGWIAMPTAPLAANKPFVQGLRLAGGRQFSPEFMALLTGLAIYTSAFIADVVRAGIQSVSHGQTEAARSLGFTMRQALQLIIFPQALRVIIPPLTSQYLNLIKNSSLAVLIGYPELFHVSGTILNQSGKAVEMIALVMAIYLVISLLTSALMNWYNRRVRLVER